MVIVRSNLPQFNQTVVLGTEEPANDGRRYRSRLIRRSNDQRPSQSASNPPQKVPSLPYLPASHQPVAFDRKQSVAPTEADINRIRPPPLAANRIGRDFSRCFKDVDDYLETWFALLREEFIRHLIDAVSAYRIVAHRVPQRRANPNAKVKRSRVEKKHPIYFEIKFTAFQVDPFIQVATFDHRRVGVDWKTTSRLLNGSLLCLTSDNFQTMFFATCQGQIDPKKPKLRLAIEGSYVEFYQQRHKTFVAVESLGYFESFRYALSHLLKIKSNTLPLKRYICDGDPTVNDANDLTGKEEYNFRSIATVDPRRVQDFNKLDRVSIFGNDIIDVADLIGFDEPQARALKEALTKELAIIQGPPGTGKTYVARRIVDILVANRAKWDQASKADSARSPILVLSYKNQSLDFLLEQLIKSGHKMVRLGYSENPKIKKYLIGPKRKKMTADERQQRYGQMSELAEKIEELGQSISNGNFVLAKPLLHIIKPPMHSRQFQSLAGPDQSLTKAIAHWLGFNCYKSDDDLKQVVQKARDALNELNARNNTAPASVISTSLLERMLSKARRDANASDDPDRVGTGDQAITMWIFTEADLKALTVSNKLSDTDLKKIRMLIELEKLHSRPAIPFNKKKVKGHSNITKLPVDKRQLFYSYWANEYLRIKLPQKLKQLKELTAKYEEAKEASFKHQCAADYHICKGLDVVAMTITAAAKYRPLVEMLSPVQVIIEEAAAVLEPFLVSALTKSMKQVIMIGDHRQLRPIFTVHDLKNQHFGYSMFERMIRLDFEYQVLERQHRMRPQIADLIRHFKFPEEDERGAIKQYAPYPRLIDGPTVTKYPHIPFMSKDVFFFDLQSQCKGKPRKLINELEALFAMELALYLLNRGVAQGRVTILSAYRGQFNLLRRRMRYKKNFKRFFKYVEDPEKKRQFAVPRVDVQTVDSYQGKENDIIIVSFVRTHVRTHVEEDESGLMKSIGFLSMINRINVALSRARMGLYCFGNFSWYAESNGFWSEITDKLRENDSIGPTLPAGCSHFPFMVYLDQLQAENKRFETAKGPLCNCAVPAELGKELSKLT